MLPRATVHEALDCGRGHMESARDGGLSRSRLTCGADVADIGRGQFRHTVPFTAWHPFGMFTRAAQVSTLATRTLPPLPRHVLIVFSERAKEQVFWIAARWIVAVMAHVQAIRDRAVRHRPRHAMGLRWRSSWYRKCAVAILIRRSRPRPTGGAEYGMHGAVCVHLRPEAVDGRDRSGDITTGRRAEAFGVQRTRLAAAFTRHAHAAFSHGCAWNLS